MPVRAASTPAIRFGFVQDFVGDVVRKRYFCGWDEPTAELLELLKETFEGGGFLVTTAVDGLDGYRKARNAAERKACDDKYNPGAKGLNFNKALEQLAAQGVDHDRRRHDQRHLRPGGQQSADVAPADLDRSDPVGAGERRQL